MGNQAGEKMEGMPKTNGSMLNPGYTSSKPGLLGTISNAIGGYGNLAASQYGFKKPVETADGSFSWNPYDGKDIQVRKAIPVEGSESEGIQQSITPEGWARVFQEDAKRNPIKTTNAPQSETGNPEDEALNFVVTTLEGEKLTPEKDGKKVGYSKYGVGFGTSELPIDQIKNMTPQNAAKIVYEKYLKGSGYDALKDKKDKAALAQFMLHRPAYAKQFLNKHGASGGEEWRNNLFANQASFYSKSNPNYAGWLNRIEKTRKYGDI